MEYAIRDVGPDDIPQIVEVEKRCFSLPWTAEQLAAQIKDAQHEFIAAISPDGTVLGYVGMMYVLDEGYISNVATDLPWRRQGIADALIGRLCASCARSVRNSGSPS